MLIMHLLPLFIPPYPTSPWFHLSPCLSACLIISSSIIFLLLLFLICISPHCSSSSSPYPTSPSLHLSPRLSACLIILSPSTPYSSLSYISFSSSFTLSYHFITLSPSFSYFSYYSFLFLFLPLPVLLI